MRYTDHALQRRIEKGLTDAEVQRIIANPARGIRDPPTRDRREHLGFSDDNRPINVVTNRAVTVVITIVEQ